MNLINKKNNCSDFRVSLKKRIASIKKFWNKKIIKNKTKFSLKEVIFVMIVTFLFGMLIGGVIMFGKGSFSGGVSDSLNEFVDTYEDILDSYYEEVDANALLQAGIEGMVGYLGDPYAAYMDAEVANDFNEEVEGEYTGIGAEIIYSYDTKTVSIGKVFENGPAAKAGVETDDILLEVEGESIEGLTNAEIADKVKGKKGTTVLIKVKREDKDLEFSIKRDKVDIESVFTEIYEENGKKVGYIRISIFAGNTAEQFRNKLNELEKEKFDSLLIDVRSNSGGYLTTVTDIISMFTEKDSIIYQLNTKGEIEKIKDKTKEKKDYPVYVLTNGSSASASEVLAAAIKENYKGTILGTKTYGKGKVQKAYDLSTGAKIKYTFQEWLTPDGNSIDSVGVTPNIEIENVIDNTNNDNQLNKVIKEITK